VVEGQVFLAPTMPLIVATLDGKPTAAAATATANVTASPASTTATTK